jgi:hypothetical protein
MVNYILYISGRCENDWKRCPEKSVIKKITRNENLLTRLEKETIQHLSAEGKLRNFLIASAYSKHFFSHYPTAIFQLYHGNQF